MDIEQDLKRFLKAGSCLEYDYANAEAGRVSLIPFSELKNGAIWIAPTEGDGFYEIPVVNLIASCDNYDPDYILMWLPNEKVYGSWDCDHWQATLFPNATWSDIALDPLKYLNAQWYPSTSTGTKFEPSSYTLLEGMPF